MSRQVKHSTVTGYFGVPIGVEVLSKQRVDKVTVSTVCLEGGHLEDPFGICSPEHGYETMVFFDGSPLLSVFTKHYKTRAAAEMGHDFIIKELLAGNLKLAIDIHYYACEMAEPEIVGKQAEQEATWKRMFDLERDISRRLLAGEHSDLTTIDERHDREAHR